MVRTLGPFLAVASICAAAAPPVRSYEGTVTIPTYQHSARETEPALLARSSVAGMYPFTTYLMPFTPDSPKPRAWRAVFVENEYLKVTWLPELGGRIFSLYDKLRDREVFYRSDVIKPAHYNPRNSWPISGLELTGPHDLHMMTLYGEPFWAHKIVTAADGSVSLVLGELDPVYGMKVNLTATLHPGIAALQMSVFCYNTRAGRMPQMFWLSGGVAATPKLRFFYPMTRTIGHTTADIADWPLYNGVDYGWDRNNKNMLGVFGIDIYDDFQGAYQFDRDYGVFRYADRRIVQGMKMWTFGYGENAKNYERGYTDNAGPYIEVQSGRHVWDGHYEWVAPHKVEAWSEWWVPVAGTNGLTTLTRDVALNLDVQPGGIDMALYGTSVVRGAQLVVTAAGHELARERVDLDPEKALHKRLGAPGGGASGMVVRVTDASGRSLIEYHRPDSDPGRQEYTPFTRPLENPPKDPEKMSAEELTLAAEFKLKELNVTAATALLERALARDPGYSRAHLLLGIHDFNAGRYTRAAQSLEKVIERDPYCDEAYYYLAMAQFAQGDDRRAERNLYYIWPNSAYYSEREYQLGRLAFLKGDGAGTEEHLKGALARNAFDLSARLLLAVHYRERGERPAAMRELAEVERIDPTNRPAQAERFFLSGDEQARQECLRLMGGQSQEAIGVSIFYREISRWKEAAQILRWVERDNHDLYGAPPEFFYTLAWCLRRAGDEPAANESLLKARAAAGHIDRFPYRFESEAPLAEAVKLDPHDAVARFALGCLLYYRERPREAIAQWEGAIAAKPDDFSARRALGLAYAALGEPLEKSSAQIERAVELNPAHVRTLNDLSSLYARAGAFDKQVAVLQKALARSPGDDDLAESLLAANLAQGEYAAADRLIATHAFAPRHRTYGLRDKYRFMRCALGAQAFHKGDYAAALQLFDSALKPPVSLGADDFQAQTSPRIEYYRGRALEKLGRTAEAQRAYENAAAARGNLSGDRDSWNSENFYMTLALDRLGRGEEATRLRKRFETFAAGERDAPAPHHRAEARYLLALIRARDGDSAEARRLLQGALEAQPDLLPARLEARGDLIEVGR